MQGIFNSQHIREIQERFNTRGAVRKVQVGEIITLQYVGEGFITTVELLICSLNKLGVMIQQGTVWLLTKHGKAIELEGHLVTINLESLGENYARIVISAPQDIKIIFSKGAQSVSNSVLP